MGTEWHEAYDKLTEETKNMSRAIRSLMEELEAMDWYQQRIDVSTDEALKRVLAHNRDEEKEHAAMVLEWIRRHDAKFDEYLRTYLFQDQIEITAIEEQVEAQAVGQARPVEGGAGQGFNPREVPSFTVGSLRNRQ